MSGRRKLLVLVGIAIVVAVILFAGYLLLLPKTTNQQISPQEFLQTQVLRQKATVASQMHAYSLSYASNNGEKRLIDRVTAIGAFRTGAVTFPLTDQKIARIDNIHFQLVDEPQKFATFTETYPTASIGYEVDSRLANTLIIKVYLTPELLQNRSGVELDRYVSAMFYAGAFMVSHTPLDPTSPESVQFNAELKKAEESDEPVVTLSKKTSQLLDHLFDIRVYAQSCGGGAYNGTVHYGKSCVGGPLAGADCQNDIACSGGSCTFQTTCENQTYSGCYWDTNINQCMPRGQSLLGCSTSANCYVIVNNPPPTNAPTPTPGGQVCAWCTNQTNCTTNGCTWGGTSTYCAAAGDGCCSCGGGGGNSCSNEGNVCSLAPNAVPCCNGMTCNESPTDFRVHFCSHCTDSYSINRYCGANTAWCGQRYSCDGQNYTCPDTQAVAVPLAPGGLSPADNATVTPAYTCGVSCTDSIDCGANWIKLQNGNTGSMDVDAIDENGAFTEETNARFGYSAGQGSADFTPTADAGSHGGSRTVTAVHNAKASFWTILSDINLLTLTAPSRGEMDVWVNGLFSKTVDTTTATIIKQVPIPISGGANKDLICYSNVCRLNSIPDSPTCSGTAGVSYVKLVNKPLSGTQNLFYFSGIVENGTTTRQGSTRFTYTGTWTNVTSLVYSGGAKQSNAGGEYVSFTTTSPSISIMTDQRNTRGSFDVYVNGVFSQNITMNSGSTTTTAYSPVISTPLSTGTVPYSEKSVQLSWNAIPKYGLYALELHPTGAACGDPGSLCREVNRPRFRFVPTANQYQWRVRALNNLCDWNNVTDKAGNWSPLYTLNINNVSTVTSTIEYDPSLSGGQAPALIGGFSGYCSSPDAGSVYNGGGSISAANGVTTYPGTVDASGTYTISNVQGGSGYQITFTPTDPNLTCTCPSGCTYSGVTVPVAQNYKFYVSPVGGAWYQTIGGDVAAYAKSGNSVIDRISEFCTLPTCMPYLSLPLTAGDNSTVGSLTMNALGAVDLSSTAGSQNNVVGPAGASRLIQMSSTPVCSENYAYFYRLYSLGLTPSDDFAANSANATKPDAQPLNGKTAYYHKGDLTVGTDWTLTGSESIVVFVDGSLRISAQTVMPQGAFLAFIVSGNIIVNPAVGTNNYASTTGQVQGVYLADGTLQVASAGAGGTDLKFVGEGVFAACSGISLPRDFARGGNSAQNNTHPTNFFIYRPDVMLSAPDRMKVPAVNWQQVAP
ncbi:MAG TPA: hypothetical protein VLH19_05750 [Patescibacteria group bacterium]|nr:hypothetical protein [Patescibacteria group bacterium]